MSETITADPAEESIYAPLSEATDNDVREPLEGATEGAEDTLPDTGGGDQKPPEAAVEAAVEAADEPDPDEEELKARNARLARTLREEKRRARQLEIEAQTLRGQRQEQPDERIEREVALRAHQMAQQQVINTRANEIYSEGTKLYGRTEFDQSVQAVNETFGQQMALVIDTLVDIDAPEKLIHHLADNPDIADTIALLPPHKLGAALAREAAKISVAKVKQVSKAPPPIRPISTSSSAEPETNMDKMSMEELAKLWDKRDFQRRMGF